MTSRPDHLWQRLWLRLETSYSPTQGTSSPDSEHATVPLSTLYHVPCLVLLGSPGLGKSNEIQLAAREAISRGEASDVIPLGRLSSSRELESRLLANRALWPKHLSINELLQSITPEKNSRWLGAYHFFLSNLEIPSLTNEEVSSALNWIISILTPEAHSRTFDRVISRLLDRAWDRCNDHSVIRSLANFLSKLASSARLYSIQEQASNFFARISQSAEPRIDLVAEIARSDNNNNCIWLAAAFPAPLISDADLSWLLQAIRTPSDVFPERVAVDMVALIVRRRDINELVAVWCAFQEIVSTDFRRS